MAPEAKGMRGPASIEAIAKHLTNWTAGAKDSAKSKKDTKGGTIKLKKQAPKHSKPGNWRDGSVVEGMRRLQIISTVASLTQHRREEKECQLPCRLGRLPRTRCQPTRR